MNDRIDSVELARALAEIARTTTDQKTGRLLMELIERLPREGLNGWQAGGQARGQPAGGTCGTRYPG
jgi:hypothetical protein